MRGAAGNAQVSQSQGTDDPPAGAVESVYPGWGDATLVLGGVAGIAHGATGRLVSPETRFSVFPWCLAAEPEPEKPENQSPQNSLRKRLKTASWFRAQAFPKAGLELLWGWDLTAGKPIV